jgi:hypothetical protein
MNRHIFRMLTLASLISAAAAALATPAMAGVTTGGTAPPDTTPPTVTIESLGRYAPGSTANINFGPRNRVRDFGLGMVVRWTASDASGICRQKITEQSYDTLGGDPDPILGGDTATSRIPPTARSHSYSESAWDYMRAEHRFVVRATDCAGNTAASTIADTVITINDDDGSVLTYAGNWDTARLRSYAGGTAHFAADAGAAASFLTSGGPVALVMEKAADRGSAQVFVDDILAATVDTHAATAQHRQVVWQALLPAGRHTVRLVNLATAGHPRIDLDAVLS